MRRLFLLPFIALASIGGCVSSDPGIDVRTVPVPTPVACVDPAKIPAETPVSTLTGDARVDSAILKAETLDLRAESGELRALIVPACTMLPGSTLPPPPAP